MTKNYFNTRDSYPSYKKESSSPIDISTYLKIANGFMKFLSRKLLDTGEITLSNKIGKIQVVGSKPNFRVENGKIKGLTPDWNSTKKLWEENEEAKKNKQLVYHFNEHTNNIRYRFRWSKARSPLVNKTLYNLVMTRNNKRTLSSLIKKGKEYIII